MLALYGWLLAPQLDKPFVYDDVNFAFGARAIAETGRPYGNQGYLLHLYQEREQWALWHPPLYLYTLGLVVAVFGTSEAAARGLGVACQLLSAALTFDIARRCLPEAPAARRDAAAVLAVALFLLCPLTAQSALILDIDNTVLMLLLTGFVWLTLRLPPWWSPRMVAALSVLYAVTLWAKLTTPILLLASLVFTRFFQGLGMRGAVQALAVGALGWTLFLVSWVVVTRATGMPADYTFTVVYGEAMDSQASSRERFTSWPAFSAGVAPAIIWIGPFFCLLVLAAGLPRLVKLLCGRRQTLAPHDLVVVLGAVIYLLYIVKLAGAFPKYHAAMLPLWSAASGALVAGRVERPGPIQLGVAALGGMAATAWLRAHFDADWDAQFTPSALEALVPIPFLIGLATAVLWVVAHGRHVWSALPLALVIPAFAWNVALNVHQRGLDGSTGYYYGRYGQTEAARTLAERLSPDELYIASKEVAWYLQNQRFVDQESWQHVVWQVDRGVWDGTWLGDDVRLLALEVGDPWWRSTYDRTLLPRYRLVGEHGNFIVLERDTGTGS